jgi:flagellar motor switch protein FliM
LSSGAGTGSRVRHDAGASVAPYDFRHPTQLNREHVRMLQMAFDGFARRLTTLLTSGMRQICHVNQTDIAQRSYEDYIRGLEPTTLMVPVTAPQLTGTCVLQLPLPVALAAVDYMLGGPGGAQPVRTLTEIETGLVQNLLDSMVSVLSSAFDSIVGLTPTLGAIEYNPQFLQVGGATDAMLIASFATAIGNESGRMTVCIPLASLLPLLTAQRPRGLTRDDTLDSSTVRERLRSRLGDVDMQLSVGFAPTSVSSDRLFNLAVGDVLRLDHKVGVPLRISSAGTIFAHAVAGRSGQRLAALVVETPEENA